MSNISNIQSRFSSAPWIDSNISIVIGGAGGIGSWLTLFLSRIGYRVRLYDFDSFEEHNMGGQFVSRKHIGAFKTQAMVSLVSEFGGRNINTYNEIYTYGDGLADKYMIAAFDNMEARKTMFNKWYEYNSGMENRDALFIDGRLLFEQMQIFCITSENTKKYREEFLFDDSEVADEVCTLKSTTHSSSIIAGLITSFLTNHITNVKENNNARFVPFRYELFLPLGLVEFE